MKEKFIQHIIWRTDKITRPAHLKSKVAPELYGHFRHAQRNGQPIKNGRTFDAKSVDLREQKHWNTTGRDQNIDPILN